MDDGFIRFELADGELVELADGEVADVYRDLWAHKSEAAAFSAATLLSYEVQLPETLRRTVTLTQAEGEALWDAMVRQRVIAQRF